MAHTLTIEVLASKAAWLHPGKGAWHMLIPKSELSLIWVTIFASGQNQPKNHCTAVDGLAPCHKKKSSLVVLSLTQDIFLNQIYLPTGL